jgi:Glutathione-dependent formaldehyde-activating enzyme
MHIDGACHCGIVSFTAQIDPEKVMICNCTDCQVLSGAPFRTIAPASAESFKLNGPTKRYVKVAASGTPRAQLKPVLQLWQCSTAPWLAELDSIPGLQTQFPIPTATPDQTS